MPDSTARPRPGPATPYAPVAAGAGRAPAPPARPRTRPASHSPGTNGRDTHDHSPGSSSPHGESRRRGPRHAGDLDRRPGVGRGADAPAPPTRAGHESGRRGAPQHRARHHRHARHTVRGQARGPLRRKASPDPADGGGLGRWPGVRAGAQPSGAAARPDSAGGDGGRTASVVHRGAQAPPRGRVQGGHRAGQRDVRGWLDGGTAGGRARGGGALPPLDVRGADLRGHRVHPAGEPADAVRSAGTVGRRRYRLARPASPERDPGHPHARVRDGARSGLAATRVRHPHRGAGRLRGRMDDRGTSGGRADDRSAHAGTARDLEGVRGDVRDMPRHRDGGLPRSAAARRVRGPDTASD
ncbi:hypothetical protein ACVILE_000261 [Streptomyces sp. M18.1]